VIDAPPEPTTQTAFDPARLRRAAVRAVQRLGDRRYRVQGRVFESYDVDLNAETPCYCRDAEYRGRPCLHELSARLADGDTELVMALGQMLLAAERM
jgi:hypothetical protein